MVPQCRRNGVGSEMYNEQVLRLVAEDSSVLAFFVLYLFDWIDERFSNSFFFMVRCLVLSCG